MAPIRILVTGAGGRMGGAVIRAVRATPELSLVGAVDRGGLPAIGQDAGLVAQAGALGVKVEDDLAQAIAASRPEVVIDFTAPKATAAHAAICAGRGVALVAGTTGLGAAEEQAISEAAKKVPVVLAPNMSVGVNVLLKVVGEVARLLGEGYDVEVLEAHHRMKKDAPSGTALKLAQVLAGARGGAPLRHGRQGLVGERPREEIGMAVLRGGDVVGEHTVFFFGEGERLELTHRATSRDQFARGAARAARWVAGRGPGLYDMQDVLGLREAP